MEAKKTRAPRTPTDKLAAVTRLLGVMNPDEIYKLGHQFGIKSPMSADILRKGIDEGLHDQAVATMTAAQIQEEATRYNKTLVASPQRVAAVPAIG